jgi:hypothetical protein
MQRPLPIRLQPVRLHFQRGVSLSGLIAILAVLAVFALVAMKVVPSVLEYNAAKSAIAAAKATNGSVQEMRIAFDKAAQINDITAITGKDLVIVRNGEQSEVAFAYEKRIPLVGNATLLIDYAATTDPSGENAAKAEGDAAAGAK